MFAKTSLRIFETLFTNILTLTKISFLAYFMLFIDISNAFVAL